MSFYPQVKSQFLCETSPSAGVILLSEREPLLLRGSAFLHVIPLLDGRHSHHEILHHLQGVVPLAEVLYILGFLQSRGYLIDATPPVSSVSVTLWELLSIEPPEALRRLQEVPVSVIACGAVDRAPFLARLSSMGVEVSDDGRCVVVLTDDYLHTELETFNLEALKRNRPWILVKPVDAELWIGPLFLPGETGCWACLAHRLQGARAVASSLQEKKNVRDPFSLLSVTSTSTAQTAYRIAAWEIAKWIVRGTNKTIEGQILSLDRLSFTSNNHRLVQRPQCPYCGNPAVVATNQSESFKLESRRKIFVGDGGRRVFSPEKTVEGLAHHISPITGIVGFLQPNSALADEKSLTPSYIAAHNFLHTSRNDSLSVDLLPVGLRGASGGKGKEATQAKASALCEAIERYSGVFQGDEARVRARLKELNGAGVHPNSCMLFSQQQFMHRQCWNAAGSWCDWAPEPFNEDQEIEWSPMWSLTYGERRWLPTAYCYYEYSRQYQARFAQADSNGCAAGCTKEEAVLQGFLELVERDSVALWWYNRLKKPVVDLTSFQDPYFQELQKYYGDLHRDLWVLDITSDLAIPAFAAISRRHDREVEDIILGFGAHLDPHLAILRALTEVNQSLPAVLSYASDEGLTPLKGDPQVSAWLKTATLGNQPYLAPAKTVAAKTQDDYPFCWNADLYTDVMVCVKTAEAKGLETLVLDQTRPDTGLHVVKVVIPGLRHFWARFAPGRLYDVPVQMGWLAEPLTEDQLNPRHVFF
ncbi:MAG: TOMM precursor leader peptide-binding protein [Deltaproteobacteria bacterium]|nr:TOMM precursor leader peptide-binding protein [Deltaproteobacteria bacterium]